MSNLLNDIKKLIKNLFYLSEGMHPVTAQKIKLKNNQTLINYISETYECETKEINKVDEDDFFKRVCNSTDPFDLLLKENAESFSKLYAFLKNNFSTIAVYRIEKGTQIPILIILSNEEDIFLLETMAEETG